MIRVEQSRVEQSRKNKKIDENRKKRKEKISELEAAGRGIYEEKIKGKERIKLYAD